jgi:hypothetical protein
MTEIPKKLNPKVPFQILPHLASPFKGEEFYKAKTLNFDIGICLEFSASARGLRSLFQVKRGILLLAMTERGN